MKKTITMLALSLASLSLTACMAPAGSAVSSQGRHHFISPQGMSYAQSALAGTPAQQQYVADIQNAGGGVVRQDNVLTIILPNLRTFERGTTNLSYGGEIMLPAAANLLKSYEDDSILITAFNPAGQQLAEKQAKFVQSYFWSNKAFSRFMASRGVAINSKGNEIPRVEVRAVLVGH